MNSKFISVFGIATPKTEMKTALSLPAAGEKANLGKSPKRKKAGVA